jgi:hypothetical protein
LLKGSSGSPASVEEVPANRSFEQRACQLLLKPDLPSFQQVDFNMEYNKHSLVPVNRKNSLLLLFLFRGVFEITRFKSRKRSTV